jgi:glycerol-3-phosphate acyltransferase PlsY
VDIVCFLATALLAYLIGSIPTGYLAGRLKGVDIRRVGSGNIGATNVFRALGKLAGVLVLVLDGIKGFAACAWGTDWMIQTFSLHANQTEYLRIVAGLAAVLGHNYTIWLRFQGGKGIATSAGVLAALVPWALAIVGLLWIVVFVLSRYVSLASIAAAAGLPLATWLTGGSRLLVTLTSVMTALAIYRHRSNIVRLLSGTEHRLSFTSKGGAS